VQPLPFVFDCVKISGAFLRIFCRAEEMQKLNGLIREKRGELMSVRRLRRGGGALAALLLMGLSCNSLLAAEWFAAPDGKPTSDGTIAGPWDLATAVSGRKPVNPGDVVWLRAGTYRNDRSQFTFSVSGETSKPVIVRNYRHEHATIDGAVIVAGNDLWIWGLEVIVSAPRPDVAMPAGSHPTELKRPEGGFQSNASRRSKIINCIVHDTNQGFSYWLGATDAEVYGCLIYQNGWVGVDRTHGHAIYTQNDKGTKWILDNIMFDPYSYLLHAYGSSRAFVNGYHVEGNIFFGGTVLMGSGKPSERITFVNNYTYKAPTQFGYNAPYNVDMICRGNYFASAVAVNRFQKAAVGDNDFVAGSTGNLTAAPGDAPTDIQWNNNRYIASSPSALEAWKKNMHFDANSTLTVAKSGRPAKNKIVLRPNKYERGRANIAVYDWEGRPDVELDLKGLVDTGQSFEIRNVQDFYGKPAATGVYRGEPVVVPLLRGSKKTELKLPGDPSGRVWHTFGDYPDFDAFVLLPAATK
jgi:hypothetical protein